MKRGDLYFLINCVETYLLLRLALIRIGCGFFIVFIMKKHAIIVPRIPTPNATIQSAVIAIKRSPV